MRIDLSAVLDIPKRIHCACEMIPSLLVMCASRGGRTGDKCTLEQPTLYNDVKAITYLAKIVWMGTIFADHVCDNNFVLVFES
jgi:hypothetical protein